MSAPSPTGIENSTWKLCYHNHGGESCKTVGNSHAFMSNEIQRQGTWAGWEGTDLGPFLQRHLHRLSGNEIDAAVTGKRLKSGKSTTL